LTFPSRQARVEGRSRDVRASANLVFEPQHAASPAATILPSGWITSPYAKSPLAVKSVVTVPPSPKLASSDPSGR
jgi:hypothetical protein